MDVGGGVAATSADGPRDVSNATTGAVGASRSEFDDGPVEKITLRFALDSTLVRCRRRPQARLRVTQTNRELGVLRLCTRRASGVGFGLWAVMPCSWTSTTMRRWWRSGWPKTELCCLVTEECVVLWPGSEAMSCLTAVCRLILKQVCLRKTTGAAFHVPASAVSEQYHQVRLRQLGQSPDACKLTGCGAKRTGCWSLWLGDSGE